MIRILCIDTATDICSVALSINGEPTDSLEATDDKSHARLISVLIKKLLSQNQLTTADLHAVAVSEGPGSYTGLRIGVSAAKGICYAKKIPLIAISTLESMAAGFIKTHSDIQQDSILIPTLDARRMEIYYATFTKNLKQQSKDKPLVVNEDTFQEFKNESCVIIMGSGAHKCKATLRLTNAVYFSEAINKAKYMTAIANEQYKKQNFEDVAYFEPAYLKPFLATKSKKNLL